jgi:hypothetical protein
MDVPRVTPRVPPHGRHTANGAWIEKASLATVDSIQSANAPRVDHDASAAELFAYI